MKDESSRSSPRAAPYLPARAAAFTLISEAVLCAAVIFLLRRLGPLLGFLGEKLFPGDGTAAALADIFGALKRAKVVPNLFWPLPPLFAGWLAFFLLFSRAKGAKQPARTLLRVLGVILLLIFLITAFLLMLWTAKVNDIRFGSVVRSLAGYLKSGAFSLAASAGEEVIFL